MNLATAHFNMIEQQIRPWDVLDQRILDVLAQVPRDEYVPERYQALAYADTRIPLGHQQTMLNPNVEGRLLQALQLQASDKVLEIGTGSGYLTACLAALAAKVDSVEFYADLANSALQKLHAHEVHNVNVVNADAAESWGEANSYDAILISGSVETVPPAFLQGLKPGGRLVVIVGKPQQAIMQAKRITRMTAKDFHEEVLFETSITPLIHAESQPAFVF